MTEDRLIELETKISHQEIAIEEMQQALLDQHIQIMALEKTLKTITDRLNAAGGGKPEVGPGNEKPPHY